jgi:hypothetical protein
MGCRILAGQIDADVDGAVLYDSCTMTAFGPVMGSEEEAAAFLKYLKRDARDYSASELETAHSAFVIVNVCECGNVRETDCMYCKHGVLVANGKHEEDDGELVPCEQEPEPAPGERFVCASCRLQAVLREKRKGLASARAEPAARK